MPKDQPGPESSWRWPAVPEPDDVEGHRVSSNTDDEVGPESSWRWPAVPEPDESDSETPSQ